MKKRLNNFFVIYTMVFAEVITIGKLLLSIFSKQAITGQFCFQTFFLRSGHVNLSKVLGKQKLMSLPLKPIIAHGPFQQWGLEFIGEINPSSSG
jgi:hypothetical protein